MKNRELKIQYISIDELKTYDNNPRNNDEAVGKVGYSILEFGFNVPIVLDADNVIVAGHTRLKAAEQLGYKKLPCVILDDLTDEQIRAYRIADNKVAEFSTWDSELLESELFELEGCDIDMSNFGFDEALPSLEINDDFFYYDEENQKQKDNTLKWEDKKIVLSEKDIAVLNQAYSEFKAQKEISSFVEFLAKVVHADT